MNDQVNTETTTEPTTTAPVKKERAKWGSKSGKKFKGEKKAKRTYTKCAPAQVINTLVDWDAKEFLWSAIKDRAATDPRLRGLIAGYEVYRTTRK